MAKDDKPQGDTFLATIEAKIAALQTLAASYRAALALGALGQPGDDIAIPATSIGASRTEAHELPQGALLGKSLPAAIKLYLSATKRKQTVREIADALKAGGVESTAANFVNNVTSSLHRLRATGDVLKFNDGWALAEFYPENLRLRIAAQSKQAAPPRRGKAKSKAKSPKPDAQKAGGKDKTAAMLEFTQGMGDAGATLDQIIEAVSDSEYRVARGYARAIMHRLLGRGRVEKRDDKYFAVAA